MCFEHPPGNRTGYCDLEGRYVSAYTTNAQNTLTINIFMYTYDALTKSGMLIHLTMYDSVTCYILVHDTYTHQFHMKFFTNMETAKNFIKNI